MLQAHLSAIESVLLAQSVAASNAGHPNIRGGPREWFISDFLAGHLPHSLEVGQGEIIDSTSQPNPPPGQYRPQVDMVLYRTDMPKISFAPNHTAFLAEGVLATIESKSVLQQGDLLQACTASNVHKNLNRSPPAITMGYIPPSILSYVVAYSGPAQMQTVAGWLPQICTQLNATPDNLVEMVIILGKGVLWRRNAFTSLPLNNAPPQHSWAYVDQPTNNLFTLFAHMLTWCAAASTPPNTMPYVTRVQYKGIHTA